MKTIYPKTNILKNYSSLFSNRKYTGDKSQIIKFSYFLVSKKTHFIGLEGKMVHNAKKLFSINQTYSVTTTLKKQLIYFTLPVHSNAVLVL
jgi:hypothetical protein